MLRLQHRAAGKVGLERPADAVDRVELLKIQRGHARAAPWGIHDEALGLEHPERVADRNEADAELVGERRERQALPGWEGAGQD